MLNILSVKTDEKEFYYAKEIIFWQGGFCCRFAFSGCVQFFPLNASAEREVLGYMGDINHDMLVNTADLVTLSRYLLGTGSLDGGEYNADLDKDGYIDSFDLVLLRQYVVGIKEKEPILGEEITTTTTTTATTTIDHYNNVLAEHNNNYNYRIL